MAALLLGQGTGRIEGTVVDPSDAPVAGAKVVCVNTGTGARHEAATTHEGVFRFPELPIGAYEVAVTHEGFQRLTRRGVELLTGHTLGLRLAMSVGSVNETIDVSAAIPLVQTASSEVQTTFDSRATSELPLNGRNPLELVVLTPGADFTTLGTSPGQQDNTGVVVNGLRSTDNNFQLDGAGFNNPMYASAPTLPNPDTLGEFTVQSANFSARESRAGAVVQLSTRSGTNRFTGSVFNFLRNEKLDARNFFADRVSEFKRNQGGGSLGGPVVRNRLFFFGSYQITVKRGSPSPKLLTVPTAAQREGVFPAVRTIYDPLNRQPFPSNTVPRARFDPSTPKLIPFTPLPTGNTNIAQLPTDDDQDDHQVLSKVDYRYGAGNNLSVRHYYDRNQIQRDTASVSGVFSTNDYRNQSLTARSTHTPRPTLTLINSLSYSRTNRSQQPHAPIYTKDLASGVVPANERTLPELRVNMANYFNFFSGGPLLFHPFYWEVRNQTAWTKGRHLVAFGGDFYWSREKAIDNSFGSGIWSFNALRTADAAGRLGDTYASFLLGLPATFQQTSSDLARLVENRYQLWIQDDWKVRPRLTLNLGLRWEPALPTRDELGPLTGFLPGRQSTVARNAPRGLIFSGDVPDSILSADWNNIAPRFGFAWDVAGSGRWVVRGGYGIFYRVIPLAVQRIVATNGTFRTQDITVNDPFSFNEPWRGYPGGNPFPYSTPSRDQMLDWRFRLPVFAQALDPKIRTSYTQSWNFTVERQVLKDAVVSVGYVANRSLKILAGVEGNPAIYRAGATTANIDSRRIHPGLASVRLSTSWQWATYHSMQVSVIKRTRRGMSVISNYVWSKALDIGTGGTISGFNWQPRDPFNWINDKGPADTDVAHRVNIALLYDLPKLGFNARPAKALLEGWQLNGIFTGQTGYPFKVTAGNRGLIGGNADFADIIGNPARPAGADPVVQWFNTAAFVLPPLGEHGTLGRNVLRGPGRAVLNFSTFKNFRASERFTVQYRFEAFNLFNHANFDPPNGGVGGVNFGRILGADDPRVLQMGLKLLF
jgi:hypothetical protein